jgi:molecular chaperone DnaK
MQPPFPFRSSARIRKTVGIDLGTTNSVIALLDATHTALITGRDEQRRMTFPSLVGYHPEQKRLVVGRAAQALPAAAHAGDVAAATAPLALPLASVKRFMGLDRSFPIGPQSLRPEEVSALILRHLRELLARTLNDTRFVLDAAVITMPAYFNHNQIEATRQAGDLAGFDVVELLHEPTAAALYYSWIENHGDANYLVYDLGGGTFDVSVIRRRLGDCEVISVSGDPFLGGDDFDRLLARHLLEAGHWIVSQEDGTTKETGYELAQLFDPTLPEGAIRFARLVQVAEGIKVALTEAERVERFVPNMLRDEAGHMLSLEISVERALFQRLIKDKVDSTIDCCREALARARERAGLALADIDYVILVGGSSRVPLVRDTVRTAFCNPDLPERVRCLEPLLHEPDLCVAYGAALRAATHGTDFIFPLGNGEQKPDNDGSALELHWSSPANTSETLYQMAGVVRYIQTASPATPSAPLPLPHWLEGGSVRIRLLASGLAEEAFLDASGTFAQDLELQADADNDLDLAICDADGREMARTLVCVRQQSKQQPLGPAVLPTQIITKPLAIEVLNRGRRVKQVVAAVGATLPGIFRCTCRTQDQAGRIVVPIFEENRVVKQMVVSDLDPTLPIGSAVEVEFAIDVKHAIEVRLCVRGGVTERCETATIERAPPADRPTRGEIDEVLRQLEELLPQFSGSLRARVKARASQLGEDLREALHYDDEPKIIQRMAELRELLQNLETSRGQVLIPPWPRFAQLVSDCLGLAAEMADKTGGDRSELSEHVHSQERYAEQAYEDHNQALYRECFDNLEKYVGYLNQLLRDALPRPPSRPPEEEAREVLEHFRNFLSSVWKQVRSRGRADLEPRLAEIAGQARGLSQRIKTEASAVVRDAHHLGVELKKVSEQLERGPAGSDDVGLLEGTT